MSYQQPLSRRYALPIERLLSRVVVSPSGCWLWTGALNQGGYARLRWGGRQGNAHRFAFEFWNGPISKGLEIDHLCRKRHCLNPDHLEAVTHQENTLRGEGAAAFNAKKDHCPSGHPYDSSNTRRMVNGARRCHICTLEATRAHRARKKEGLILGAIRSSDVI